MNGFDDLVDVDGDGEDDDDLVQIIDDELTAQLQHEEIEPELEDDTDRQLMPPPPLPIASSSSITAEEAAATIELAVEASTSTAVHDINNTSVAVPSISTPSNPAPTIPAIPAPAPIKIAKSSNSDVIGSLNERTTRSRGAHSANSRTTKLKLKLSDKATSSAPGTSFLGAYDRELDSDAEEEGNDLLFEEHFILRMPSGEDTEKLRKMVQNRESMNDVGFKFKDSRRAQFHIGKNTYSAKLVDLPAIIESQKTWDNKHMFKVADISQMLLVGDKIDTSAPPEQNHRSFVADEFIYQHGLTPPLKWVRKRRFRKRLNKRTIETVEEEVERLLSEDAMADSVKYDVLENVNPDLSDSEFIDRDPADPNRPGAATPGYGESEAGDAPTPAGTVDGDEGEGREGVDGDIDEELAAELDLALGSEGEKEDKSGSEDDEDEEDEDMYEDADADLAAQGSGEEEEDDEEDYDGTKAEDKRARKLLNEEIRDLEAALNKKSVEIERSLNPLIRRRFEDALRKLRADLELKLVQRGNLDERSRLRKEEKAAAAAAAAAATAENDKEAGVDGGNKSGARDEGRGHISQSVDGQMQMAADSRSPRMKAPTGSTEHSRPPQAAPIPADEDDEMDDLFG